MALYLLHFDRPYKHARHYLGYAKDVAAMHARVDVHYAATYGDGQHHKLMQAVRKAGISFTLARIWPHGSRDDERRKKTNGHARRCPLCKDERRKSEVGSQKSERKEKREDPTLHTQRRRRRGGSSRLAAPRKRTRSDRAA